MQNERRKHRRYRVKDNAFAVINLEPVKVVPIIDIAIGGLSIYLDDGARGLDTLSKLEIMVADCSFYLEKVPFQIVAESRTFPNHNANLTNGRRCGLRFGNLRPVQESHLKHFIRRYTEKGSFAQVLSSFSRFLDPIRAPRPSVQSCNTRVWHILHRSTP